MEWLALIALLSCLITGFQAYDNWENYRRKRAYAFGALTIALFVFGKVYMPGQGDDCYTDWDGRSNPTVCV